jgi:Tol biopolymer transport system component
MPVTWVAVRRRSVYVPARRQVGCASIDVMRTGFVVAISLVALLGSGCGSDSTARPELPRVSQLFEVASRGGSARQLTDDRFDHSAPEWSPSGLLLADIAGTSSKSVVEVLRTDGSLVRRVPAGSGPVDEAPAWSPDGRELAFVFLRDAEQGVIGTLLVTDLRGRTRRLAEPVTGRPGWSPDGRWLAFRRGAAVPTVVGGKEVPTDGVGEDLALVAAASGGWPPRPATGSSTPSGRRTGDASSSHDRTHPTLGVSGPSRSTEEASSGSQAAWSTSSPTGRRTVGRSRSSPLVSTASLSAACRSRVYISCRKAADGSSGWWTRLRAHPRGHPTAS